MSKGFAVREGGKGGGEKKKKRGEEGESSEKGGSRGIPVHSGVRNFNLEKEKGGTEKKKEGES